MAEKLSVKTEVFGYAKADVERLYAELNNKIEQLEKEMYNQKAKYEEKIIELTDELKKIKEEKDTRQSELEEKLAEAESEKEKLTEAMEKLLSEAEQSSEPAEADTDENIEESPEETERKEREALLALASDKAASSEFIGRVIIEAKAYADSLRSDADRKRDSLKEELEELRRSAMDKLNSEISETKAKEKQRAGRMQSVLTSLSDEIRNTLSAAAAGFMAQSVNITDKIDREAPEAEDGNTQNEENSDNG